MYDEEFKDLMKKIECQVHQYICNLEDEIRVNMEKKIKKLAVEKVKKVEKMYQKMKEKKNLQSKETVDVGNSEQKINIPQD